MTDIPQPSEIEMRTAEVRETLARYRSDMPRLRAEIESARQEHRAALRVRDRHRASVLRLLAQLTPDRQDVVLARCGIVRAEIEGWSTPASSRVGAPHAQPLPLISHGQCVYFIQAVSGGPIKIGTSSDVEQRLSTLQCASPVKLRIIGLISGGIHHEAALHRRLAVHRLHGEWFADAPEVLAAVAEALS